MKGRSREKRRARMRKKTSIDRELPDLLSPRPPRLSFFHSQNMYLLLVTNKGSNILEDLETLRLLGKV